MNPSASGTLTVVTLGLLVCCGIPARICCAPTLAFSRGADFNSQATPVDDADKIVASARNSLAAGRLDEAIARVDTVLHKSPGNRAAVDVKVSARVRQRLFSEALSAYDSYIGATKKPEPAILAIIARADLEQIAQAREPSAAAALERLARHGDAEALKTLKHIAKTAPASAGALDPVLGLARLGDKDAVDMLGSRLDTAAAESRSEVLRLVEQSGARELGAKAASYLSDPLPQVRAAAAKTVGALQFHGAVARLQELFRDDVAVVKMFAAAALMRLGQTSVEAYVAGILASEVPEVRLIAAEAYQSSKTKHWIPRVKELLGDRNDVHRIRAAELLACCDQPAARSVLESALGSDNPSMRAEAAQILESTGLADARIARRLMADPFSAVRIHGDGVVLRQTNPTPGR